MRVLCCLVFGHFKDRAMIEPVLPNTKETKMAASQEEMKITETSIQGQKVCCHLCCEPQYDCVVVWLPRKGMRLPWKHKWHPAY